MDLGGAYYREGRLDDAERHVRRALDLEHPTPGLGFNYLACIAARRGDLVGMEDHFTEATRRDAQHWVLARNQRALRAWAAAGRQGNPDLVAEHDFQLLERPAQPTLPGPLADDFAVWHPPVAPPARPVGSSDPRKLRVVAV
jgi:hypothetical protein